MIKAMYDAPPLQPLAAALKEATETPAQTAKEAGAGDSGWQAACKRGSRHTGEVIICETPSVWPCHTKTWGFGVLNAENQTQVAVLGLGYVGCVTAACLASLGHRVLGIDRDQHKVDNVLNGRAPFYEPGLDELVRENTAAGRLSASSSADGVADADIALICVGTPSEKNGNLGLGQLRRVVEDIIEHYPHPDHKLILAIRSTAF